MGGVRIDWEGQAYANYVAQRDTHPLRVCCISLHGMWRAVGSPQKLDPLAWVEQAMPLVVGLKAYVLNSIGTTPDIYGDPESEGAPTPEFVEIATQDLAEEFDSPFVRPGDLMVHLCLAPMYAFALAGHLAFKDLDDQRPCGFFLEN